MIDCRVYPAICAYAASVGRGDAVAVAGGVPWGSIALGIAAGLSVILVVAWLNARGWRNQLDKVTPTAPGGHEGTGKRRCGDPPG